MTMQVDHSPLDNPDNQDESNEQESPKQVGDYESQLKAWEEYQEERKNFVAIQQKVDSLVARGNDTAQPVSKDEYRAILAEYNDTITAANISNGILTKLAEDAGSQHPEAVYEEYGYVDIEAAMQERFPEEKADVEAEAEPVAPTTDENTQDEPTAEAEPEADKAEDKTDEKPAKEESKKRTGSAEKLVYTRLAAKLAAEKNGEGEATKNLSVAQIKDMITQLQNELTLRQQQNLKEAAVSESPDQEAFTQDLASERAFSNTAPDNRAYRRASLVGDELNVETVAAKIKPIDEPEETPAIFKPRHHAADEPYERYNRAAGESDAEGETKAEEDQPDKATSQSEDAASAAQPSEDENSKPERTKAKGKKVPIEGSEDKGTSINIDHDKVEPKDEHDGSETIITWADIRASKSEQKPDKNGTLSWEEYVQFRPSKGTYPDKNGRARDAETNKFADPTSHRKALVGEEKYLDYNYEASRQSLDYYDKVNGIDNEGKQFEAPDFSTLTLTELAKELALTQYQYHLTEGGKESDIEAAGTIEKEIREAAKALYLSKAKESGIQELIDNYEKEMEGFESMADRYLRAKLEDEALKTEAGKETFKSATKRWWSGVKNRFGVGHWDQGWNAPADKAPASLNKDVVEEETWEEKQEKKKENRYKTIIGRSVVFAQSPKMERKYGGESLTWDIQKSELLRDYPDQFEEAVDGSLSLKDTEAPQTDQRKEAEERLRLAEQFRDR